ncbi:MAG TPA: right-handed parallel beta-helix repeat-containing protein [Phycisphaerales bacterium]|nr:right-handed parallel beta-helix repeat-containing protein [Phycisphaerales bacterium]
MRTLNLGLVVFFTAIMTAALTAGPLNPPSGPVAPTYRTLSQVEPRIPLTPETTPGDADSTFRITQSGSYYLVGNLSAAPGKHGIEVASDDVTIDLQGYSISGQSTSLSGIHAVTKAYITVRNGVIDHFGQHGIDLIDSEHCRVEDVDVHHCGDDGVRVGGYSLLHQVRARSNAGIGIDANISSLLSRCIASSNGTGMDIGARSIARDCEASINQGNGFETGGLEAIFENCAAFSNAKNGFKVGSQGRVERCVASTNKLHGIEFGLESHIVANVSRRNGLTGVGYGLYGNSEATRCRVENNTCTGNDAGIQLEGPSNLVIGNRCSVNTVNFDIVSGNRVGTIVVLPVAGAVSGNSGGAGTAEVTDNLAY